MTVTIAYVHEDMVGAAFTESLLRLISYDHNNGGQHLLHETGWNQMGAFIPVWGRGGDMAYFRNAATASFLETDSDWLLWVDSDMGFPPDAVERLLEAAHPTDRPIVGGLCFIEHSYSTDFQGGLVSRLAPTIYDWIFLPNGEGYKLLPRLNYERNSLVETAATGTGFVLVHRSVFERITDWCRENGAPGNIWYERIPGPNGALSGEDVSFCMRANQLGIPIHVDTGLRITHQKTVWLNEADYDHRPTMIPEQNASILPKDQWPRLLVNRHAVEDAARVSPLGRRQVTPADDRVLIIVPVMQRPFRAAPFMQSLNATIGDKNVDVIAMADTHDRATAEAWRISGANVDIRTYRGRGNVGGSFAQKVNAAWADYVDRDPVTGHKWIFLVGDDVTFHHQWLDYALDVAHTSGSSVIGTNDLGTAAVRNGAHATHMLISVEYISRIGSGWDGPGVVCHEGYGHWYVDNEIVESAKQRNQWTPCLESIVEHQHPIFGKAPDDAVYRLGQQSAQADGDLYRHRLEASARRIS